MQPSWVTDARVLVVAGKGGVGSSTVAAAAAVVAARAGADVVIISVDGRPGLGKLLGGRALDDTDQVLCSLDGGGRVRGRTIPPAQAFNDYLELRGISSVVRRAAASASLPSIAAATPGLEHLLVLGKVKELERQRSADLIVVDAPPAGHAASFLRSATALQEMVSSGPVRVQADEVAEMLADARRCQALLVTLPEVTPVNEVVELAYDVEDRLGLSLAPLVVNACWPDRDGLLLSASTAARQQRARLSPSQLAALETSSAFGRPRLELQRQQLRRLAEILPLPIVTLPRLPTALIGTAELHVLADALTLPPMVNG